MAVPAAVAPRRRERIEINIPLRRRYVRGSGPKSQPISLLPPRDSDAFIIDKVIDPATSLPGKLGQKKICYIIGWPDLPAARVLIPCCRALEYVSPGVMEDWEYRESLRREEEEWQSAVDEAKAASLREVARKPRGRPPRGSYVERPISPPPMPGRKTEEEQGVSRKKVSGPSLSTPSKRRLADFLEVEDVLAGGGGGEDVMDEDEQAILQQLQGELSDGATDAMSGFGLSRSEHSEEDMDVDLVPTPLIQETQVPLPSYVTSFTPIQQITLGPVKTVTSAPPEPAVSRKETRISPPLSGMKPKSQSTKPGPAVNGHAPFPTAAKPQEAKPMLQKKKPGPKPHGKDTVQANGTTGPLPEHRKDQARPPTQKKPKTSPAPPASSKPDLGALGKLQDQSAAAAEATAQAEQAYEVKRLEGDQWFELEDGRMVRYYKVRWVGDWPPDQNPTWEPEENISRSLVRKYLKRKEKKEAGGSSLPSTPQKKQQQQQPSCKKKGPSAQRTLSPWMGSRKFSSVQEAFEGEDEGRADSEGRVHDANDALHGTEEPQDDDEFKVTEDKTSLSVSSPPPRTSLGVNLARQFSMFGKR